MVRTDAGCPSLCSRIASTFSGRSSRHSSRNHPRKLYAAQSERPAAETVRRLLERDLRQSSDFRPEWRWSQRADERGSERNESDLSRSMTLDRRIIGLYGRRSADHWPAWPTDAPEVIDLAD